MIREGKKVLYNFKSNISIFIMEAETDSALVVWDHEE